MGIGDAMEDWLAKSLSRGSDAFKLLLIKWRAGSTCSLFRQRSKHATDILMMLFPHVVMEMNYKNENYKVLKFMLIKKSSENQSPQANIPSIKPQ